ncbi:putative 1-phosphatidylinositol 3-phosphate 5-kinase [Leptopilina boulardi]|uniref:putative 1-phosphatidylinositol 3-phosphate 5-kinase n=1 Tax=Leptopilina boulardi TaxID=63433 RepID=UPI0021F6366A|nr:putative 1-phosphatidylinositol 3-phosphate 5-kinase [Leptopilina boulardi]XP_051166230.1 putative 1-phosphatidylinositol 3-phosphate 5-kinase [Leptopilina boulardi]
MSKKEAPVYATSSTMCSFSEDRKDRNPSTVLKGIRIVVGLENSKLPSEEPSMLRNYLNKECYQCSETLTFIGNRRHCRVCGEIFCPNCCCYDMPGMFMNRIGHLRVCSYCCKTMLNYLQLSSDIKNNLSIGLKVLKENLEKHYG